MVEISKEKTRKPFTEIALVREIYEKARGFHVYDLFLFCRTNNAQSQHQSIEKKVAHPEIPRVSAYEAYDKYKEGKALIFHGGGERY